jgi:hypothetical protein
MACRHHKIRFLETGDVEHHFFRHHSNTMLHRYLIEWPAEQVDILGGQCLEDHNFQRSVTKDGFLLLEWNVVKEAESRLGRGVTYVKRGYLTRPANEPTLWHYKEQFRMKPDYAIWLHSPYDCISAIKQRSIAVFESTSGKARNYHPRDLSECMFREPGLLSVNWILEKIEKPWVGAS